MPPSALRVVALATLLATGTASGAGDGLKLERRTRPVPPGWFEETPVYVIADRIEGVGENEIEAAGNAELRKPNARLTADRIRYFRDRDEVEATGNVHLYRDGDLVTGPRLRMRVEDGRGIMESPTFQLAPRERAGRDFDARPLEGRGSAATARFEGDDRYRVSEGSFTTCKPDERGWAISAEELDLDFGRQVGTAYNARLTFLGLSTPPFPYATFPLSDERKSGFLPPIVGIQGKNGFEVAAPYYWNIAPNQDATVTPRLMAKRGFMLQTEYRYLGTWSAGVPTEARFDYLPNDRILDRDRWATAVRSRFARGAWTGLLNYNRVSDDDYFRDLSGRLAVATQTFLPQDGSLTYSGRSLDVPWAVTARMQNWQTLQDPLNPVTPPYNRLPQVLGRATKQMVGGLDAGIDGEFVAFDVNEQSLPTGNRAYAYPFVSWPIIRSGGYFTPKAGLHYTRYDLDRVSAGTPTSQTRALPIASLDSGLTFERQTEFGGRDVLQTLEPRLYYLYVPYRDQDEIPLFDTTVADFNYAQLFSENTYIGQDRISNANQLTAAITSRIILPGTGQETLRMLIGQRYYFEDQRVALTPTSQVRTNSVSPWLVSLGGIVWPKVLAEVTAQLDAETYRYERLNFGVRYQPERGNLINFGYRYTDPGIVTAEEINQLDVSGQWRFGKWKLLGRYSYDLVGKSGVEKLAGLEYNDGCWTVRAVAQQFPTATDKQTTLFYVQLELDGLSKIGSDPIEAIRRNIPGYAAGRRGIEADPFDYFE